MASILTCPSHLLAGGYYWHGIWTLRHKRLLPVNDVGGKRSAHSWVICEWLVTEPHVIQSGHSQRPSSLNVLLLYNQLTPSSQACIWLPILHASTSKLFRNSSDITPEFIVTWSELLTIQTTTFDNSKLEPVMQLHN